jgi:hypothetical protein
MPKTRKEELDQLEAQIAELRAKLETETSQPRREKLQRQIDAKPAIAKLINERHDKDDQQRLARSQAIAAAEQAVIDAREAQFKAQARRRFPGSEEEFIAAYPAIKAEWQRDLALGRAPADEFAEFRGMMPRL